MKAALLSKFGPPESLQIKDVPVPAPSEGEVLIRVRCIGLNFAEVFSRLGVYPSIPALPFIPGIECSGVVESLGRGVRGFKRGDRVMVFSKQGTYAEFVCTKSAFVRKMARRMSFEEGAAIPVAGLSAFHGLVTLGHMRKGEKLLLHAAAGGVGTIAIQIARHIGVEVFATAGSPEKLEVARKLGAHHVINYRTEDFSEFVRDITRGEGVDVVMDSVGGSVLRKSWPLLAPMGRYVLYGFASVTGERTINKWRAFRELMQVPRIRPTKIPSKNVSFAGFNLYFLTHKIQYLNAAFRQVVKWYDAGIIKPMIGARFDIENIADAHAFLQSRKSIGKVIVNIGGRQERGVSVAT